MGKRAKTKLSSGEMEVMSLLWAQGPISLADAHEAFGRPIGYTTMQTRLNRLVDKGLAKRSTDRPALYSAAISQDSISANHLDDLLARVTGGNIVPLVAHLVNDRSLTEDEIDQLKGLISQAEQRLKPEERSDS